MAFSGLAVLQAPGHCQSMITDVLSTDEALLKMALIDRGSFNSSLVVVRQSHVV